MILSQGPQVLQKNLMNIVLCDRPYETFEVKYQCCRRNASRQTVLRLQVTEFVGTLKNVSLFRIFFGGQETIFSVPERKKIGLFCKKNVRLPRNETPPTQKDSRLSFASEAFGRAGTSLGSKPRAQF